MTPSVRSRLWGSGVSFGLGFVVANYGLLGVPRPDQWIWFAGAALFMLTGALGVLFADSGSHFSVWAVLGLELLVIFALIPFAWALSMALTPADVQPLSIWPSDRTSGNFSAVLDSTAFRRAALNSLIVAGTSTLIAVVLAVSAAYAIVHSRFRGRRTVYGLILGALLAPLVTLAGPMADQALSFGLYDTKRSLAACYLALTLPLALWLSVSLFSRIPRSLRDAARTEGATRLQVVRKVDLPVIGPGLVVVTLIVFFVAANDLVLGLALGTTDNSLPVPATLASFGGEFDNPAAATAAAGLLWFLPVLLFVLVFQRKIVWLLGRSNR
jgi:multiple sugar transport system permease protein